ncbi:MAG: Txe/YoeB family addiction module toxin [Phycisphaerales bacterium]|nr:Txe/YoeB family addiction module toxin [Phycisphaerales bacterium]
MKVTFAQIGWKEYLHWASQDKKTFKRINALIEDIQRNGHNGIGKPEPLRHDLAGFWSRRIDEKNRLIYRLIGKDAVEIAQCKGHYGDK